MTNHKRPRSIYDIKGTVAQEELRKAHYIIAVLSLSLAFILALGAVQPVQFETTLTIIAILLLTLVALASLYTAIALNKVIKK